MTADLGITVGELKRALEIFDDDSILEAGGLTFFQLKKSGEKSVRIEFEERLQKDRDGKIIFEKVE